MLILPIIMISHSFSKWLGLPHEVLAKKANLHRNYVGGIECGERNLGLTNLVELAPALFVKSAKQMDGIQRTFSNGQAAGRLTCNRPAVCWSLAATAVASFLCFYRLADVFLRVFVKRLLAVGAAEKILLFLVCGLSSRSRCFHIHATDWVFHCCCARHW